MNTRATTRQTPANNVQSNTLHATMTQKRGNDPVARPDKELSVGSCYINNNGQSLYSFNVFTIVDTYETPFEHKQREDADEIDAYGMTTEQLYTCNFYKELGDAYFEEEDEPDYDWDEDEYLYLEELEPFNREEFHVVEAIPPLDILPLTEDRLPLAPLTIDLPEDDAEQSTEEEAKLEASQQEPPSTNTPIKADVNLGAAFASAHNAIETQPTPAASPAANDPSFRIQANGP